MNPMRNLHARGGVPPLGGPFLFGEFGAADAFYAPVVARTRNCALPLSPVA